MAVGGPPGGRSRSPKQHRPYACSEDGELMAKRVDDRNEDNAVHQAKGTIENAEFQAKEKARLKRSNEERKKRSS